MNDLVPLPESKEVSSADCVQKCLGAAVKLVPDTDDLVPTTPGISLVGHPSLDGALYKYLS